MTYRVIISDEALDGAAAYIDWLLVDKQAPEAAERWWNRALRAIDSLASIPNGFSLAPEDEHRDYTIRVVSVRPCLFLYNVDEANRVVRVIACRHGSQLPRPKDLPKSL